MSGFDIQNGELKKYSGNDEIVEIPEGVTSIGDYAFHYRDSLKSITIPQGITSIGDNAFSRCTRLTSITIPEGVTKIGEGAFSYCDCLTSLIIPESVTSIGDEAFYGCWRLTSILIPEGVTRIGNNAFSGCESLKSLTIPESVTSLETIGCKLLEWVSIAQRQAKCFDYHIMENTSCALIIRNEGKRIFIAYSAKTSDDNVTAFYSKGDWNGYDLELLNNGPTFKYRLSARLLGMAMRLMDPVQLQEQFKIPMIEFLTKNIKKLIALAEELDCPELIDLLFEEGIVNQKNEKTIRKLLSASPVSAVSAFAETPIVVSGVKQEDIGEKVEKTKEYNYLQEEYKSKLKLIKGESIIRKMKLVGKKYPEMKMKDGTAAPAELFLFILASYGSQLDYFHYAEFIPEADMAAESLAYDSLCNAMEVASDHLNVLDYPAVIPLLCRFGNSSLIDNLIKEWKSWGSWYSYGMKGRNAREYLKKSMVLSDTKEAAFWLDEQGLLSKYAALRGANEDEYRDMYLSDIGLDEQGCKSYDLGKQTVMVRLQKELNFIFELPNGKTAKSLPKKGSDEEKYNLAKDDFDQIRKSVKKILKIRGNVFFADFLSGRSRKSEEWQEAYLKNRLLRKAAGLIVWAQGKSTFTVTDEEIIDSKGKPYTIKKANIKVAHPMEMKEEKVSEWQAYFLSNEIKQPFIQMWEPVVDPSLIKKDRYAGLKIPFYRFKGQDKHGIITEDRNYQNNTGICFKECDTKIKRLDSQRDFSDMDTFEVKSFQFKKYTRQVNHIVGLLDKWTVYDRIIKDDVSVAELLDYFTIAQIAEFLRVAQENNSVNVTALLLEYKNAHYPKLDPMVEFTLEW